MFNDEIFFFSIPAFKFFSEFLGTSFVKAGQCPDVVLNVGGDKVAF